MKKSLVLSAAFLALPLVLIAAERVVVLEIFTGTWCQYCPGAARGADDLSEEHPGKVLVIEYHGGDIFENTESTTRESFYGGAIRGYPAAVFDGVDTVIGGSSSGSMFFSYNSHYNTRYNITSPLTITLNQTTSSLYSSSGTLTATITNTSNSSVSGTVHFTITESHIPYVWQTLDTLDFVERTMLPNASGEAITLASGETKVVERTYNIDSGWPSFTNDDNIQFGCFVQSSATSFPSEIYQAAVLDFGATTGVAEGTLNVGLEVPLFLKVQGSLSVSLKEASYVTLELFDASGRLIKTIYAGHLSPGTHPITLTVEDLPGGAYFVKARQGAASTVKKLLVLH